MVSKRTGKPPGRPEGSKKPLATDPERYVLAFMSAHLDCARRCDVDSERRLAETVAALLQGALIGTFENLEKMADGEPFEVAIEKTKDPRNKQGVGWRDRKSPYRPRADDLARKLRHFRRNPWIDEDARWLTHMSEVWRICLEGREEKEDYARYMAELVGERKYLERVMLPMLAERSEQRARGLLQSEINLVDIVRIIRIIRGR
jgi:hypothetical protein